MVDEIYDRQYRAARAELNAAILGLASRFGKAARDAFGALNRIEYEAPWTIKPRRARSH